LFYSISERPTPYDWIWLAFIKKSDKGDILQRHGWGKNLLCLHNKKGIDIVRFLCDIRCKQGWIVIDHLKTRQERKGKPPLYLENKKLYVGMLFVVIIIYYLDNKRVI